MVKNSRQMLDFLPVTGDQYDDANRARPRAAPTPFEDMIEMDTCVTYPSG